MTVPSRCPALLLVLLAASCSTRDDVEITVPVTATGGIVTSHDGLFSIEIPPGALAVVTDVSISIRDDAAARHLSSRLYQVSPLELRTGAEVVVRYHAPRTPWVGQRAMATFDGGVTELADASERDYDHRVHVASARYETLARRTFGLATVSEALDPGGCAVGCTKGEPGCVIDVDAAPDCDPDGWDAPPNTGPTFVISKLGFAFPGRGYDVDARCRAKGDCVDNAFGLFAMLGNDPIRQGLLGGEHLLLLELSGLDHPDDQVSDGSVTIKFYEARDFDDPIYPANNFLIPAAESRCCEFLIDGASLEDRNARARTSARLDGGAVRTVEPSAVGLWGSLPTLDVFPRSDEQLPYAKGALRHAQVSFRLRTDEQGDVDGLTDGLLGGVVLASELAVAPNPYCRTLNNLCQRQLPNSSMLDLVLPVVGGPDIDLDGDGLETIGLGPNGRVDVCTDGDGTPIPPVDAERPESCAEDARLADGYSVAYTFEAIVAKVKGVTPTP